MQQGLVVGFPKFLERPPHMRCEFTDEDLPSVALASKVYALGVDLVGDVDQKHVEKVVRDVIGLEYNLDLVGLVGLDGSLLGHKDEGDLLPVVLNSVDKAFKVEIDREGGHILDREGLLGSLT